MKIYFRKDFYNILNDPSEWVTLGEYTFGKTTGGQDSFEKFDRKFSRESDDGRSPTDDNNPYTYEYVIKPDGEMQIHLEVPSTDIGFRDSTKCYTIIYFLFNSRKFTREVGFLGVEDNNPQGLKSISDLSRGINLINIPFQYSCQLPENLTSGDSQILEGIGNENYRNIFWKTDEFISAKSADRYLYEKMTEEKTSYLRTTEINKFGIKLY